MCRWRLSILTLAFPQVKTTLLLLMIERCKNSDALDAIGMGFFRGLLADRNPEIACALGPDSPSSSPALAMLIVD